MASKRDLALVSHPQEGELDQPHQTSNVLCIQLKATYLLHGLVDEVEDAPREPTRDMVLRASVLEEIKAVFEY